MLATGILVLPGLAEYAAGPASIVAVAVVLALSIPLAGPFAALTFLAVPLAISFFGLRVSGTVQLGLTGLLVIVVVVGVVAITAPAVKATNFQPAVAIVVVGVA